ncbi:30S ribosomal protein S9 [Candidatus Dependentiae bacterium]|nr:30S ribosomal protein S9 [Candidatus Dependentiae bacterium]
MVTAKRQTTTKAKAAAVAHGVGRRKSAIARVWLKRGTGAMIINGKEYQQYFDTESSRKNAAAAFTACPQASVYDVSVNVMGGGLAAQADAVKLGMARAMVEINEEWRSALRAAGLLTVDARLKERKKYGRKAARRGFQFVKR